MSRRLQLHRLPRLFGSALPGAALLIHLAPVLSGCAEPGPRPLSEAELSRIAVDGGVSKWLPSRFSAILANGSELTLTAVELEIDGRSFRRDVEIPPGAEERISLQFVFPEDPGFGTIDPESVFWRLVGATGEEG